MEKKGSSDPGILEKLPCPTGACSLSEPCGYARRMHMLYLEKSSPSALTKTDLKHPPVKPQFTEIQLKGPSYNLRLLYTNDEPAFRKIVRNLAPYIFILGVVVNPLRARLHDDPLDSVLPLPAQKKPGAVRGSQRRSPLPYINRLRKNPNDSIPQQATPSLANQNQKLKYCLLCKVRLTTFRAWIKIINQRRISPTLSEAAAAMEKKREIQTCQHRHHRNGKVHDLESEINQISQKDVGDETQIHLNQRGKRMNVTNRSRKADILCLPSYIGGRSIVQSSPLSVHL